MGVTYHWEGDVRIPDLVLSDTTDYHVGKYGRMRHRYLKEHRRVLFNIMLTNETLAKHVADIDAACRERLEVLIPAMAKSLDYAEDTNEEAIRKDISAMELMLENLSRQEQKYAVELDNALKEYAGLEEQAAEVDHGELMTQRLAIRTEKETDAVARVKSAYGDQYQPLVMSDAKRDVAKMLDEVTERKSVREKLKKKQPEQKTPQPKKRRRDEWER